MATQAPTDAAYEARGGRKPNRLIHETSPYLLQHAHNPVDWYPWGPEALERARREDKPILLSIGYSACHWCHVMERESFEDEETARLMNEHFVCIKVDREERPDLDAIYMEAVQAMTRHGGWPMTVFLLPDGTPFYGGTYFPPTPHYGMPSFKQVLLAVASAYRSQREQVERSAAQLRELLCQQPQLGGMPGPDALTPAILEQAEHVLAQTFDETHGGFGGAPKFPQPMSLEALLRIAHRTGKPETLRMVRLTLDKMAQGGMYDQLGGGFHRYSVDAQWLVPHFEKMLYDNAQLARVYLHAYLATGERFYRRICEETLDYVLREMASPEGGFYSTQDADSEGEEGKFYLWTPGEVRALLGEEEGQLFCAYFDVTERGSFEGKSILHTPRSVEEVAAEQGVSTAHLEEVIERGRRILLEARAQRIKPARDEKILTAWNGLMLRSFAEAAAALERDDYRRAAVRNAEFVLSTLRAPGDGSLRLYRSYKDGRARHNAYLEDYAGYAAGLLALYEATFDQRWLEAAQRLASTMIEQFADEAGGGFFDTSADHEALLTRPKSLYDSATPSGNSMACEVLLRLAEYLDDAGYRARAERLLAGLRDALAQHPSAFGELLCALDFYLGPVRQIALAGDPHDERMRALLRVVYGHYLPNKVVALRLLGPEGEKAAAHIPLLQNREPIGQQATAYVCEHFTCRLPVTDPQALKEELGLAG